MRVAHPTAEARLAVEIRRAYAYACPSVKTTVKTDPSNGQKPPSKQEPRPGPYYPPLTAGGQGRGAARPGASAPRLAFYYELRTCY